MSACRLAWPVYLEHSFQTVYELYEIRLLLMARSPNYGMLMDMAEILSCFDEI